MRNGDQKMQAARKEEQVVEVPSIDFVFKGSTMGTRRLRSDDTHEVPKGQIAHPKSQTKSRHQRINA